MGKKVLWEVSMNLLNENPHIQKSGILKRYWKEQLEKKSINFQYVLGRKEAVQVLRSYLRGEMRSAKERMKLIQNYRRQLRKRFS